MQNNVEMLILVVIKQHVMHPDDANDHLFVGADFGRHKSRCAKFVVMFGAPDDELGDPLGLRSPRSTPRRKNNQRYTPTILPPINVPSVQRTSSGFVLSVITHQNGGSVSDLFLFPSHRETTTQDHSEYSVQDGNSIQGLLGSLKVKRRRGR